MRGLLVCLLLAGVASCGTISYQLNHGLDVQYEDGLPPFAPQELDTALSMLSIALHAHDSERFSWRNLDRVWRKAGEHSWVVIWREDYIEEGCPPGLRCVGMTWTGANYMEVTHLPCLGRTAYLHEALHMILWYITGLKRDPKHEDPAWAVIPGVDQELRESRCPGW